MKFLLFAPLAFWIAGCGYSAPTCQHDLEKFLQDHEDCAIYGREIFNYIPQLASDRMTYIELQSIVQTTCAKADWSDCSNAILEASATPCDETNQISVQTNRNYLRMAFTFAQYLCQNNGTKYLDFVKNDGAKCFDTHEEHSACFKNGRSTVNKDYFTDDEICAYYDVHMMCSHHLVGCGNDDLLVVYTQILQSLLNQFGCWNE